MQRQCQRAPIPRNLPERQLKIIMALQVDPELLGGAERGSEQDRVVRDAPNGLFVDVGVWKGQSTIYVAETMRRAGRDGCVLAVDTFLGSAEHWTNDGGAFTRRHGRPDLYEAFLDNVFLAGVADLVVPMPQTSLTAAALLLGAGLQAGAVHIDAGHAFEEVVADDRAFWKLLAPGGFLVGDDYVDAWPGVVEGAHAFALEVGEDTCAMELALPKWVLRKRG